LIVNPLQPEILEGAVSDRDDSGQLSFGLPENDEAVSLV